ncbi:unnamed protein product [Notodromas monacha]|uniref:Arrestin C-terminal-like domain-containing protein n=1 Tax=Notodromas monacha TaxID=399045 RepID=A0A7R9BKQ5_9CRUS|nr:unnamed protein product [Notodromas monacha]CAG0917276.1 unnamed protein product [Notodromas monacha]
MRENTVKKEAAVIQIIINLDYSSYLKGIPRNSSYCILPVGDGRTATGFMAPWRMNENRTISEPIPELKIKLSKGGDQNQNSFRDHKCSQQQVWPAVYKPGDIVRGVVETNFDSVTCDTKDGIWKALWQPSRLTSTWQTCTSSPPSETHVQPLSKSLFPDFGSQTLSTTRSTTVSATTKSSTTSCYVTPLGDNFLAHQKALWQPSRLTSTWQTCTSSPPSETHVVGNRFREKGLKPRVWNSWPLVKAAREKLRFECTLPAANLPQTFFGTYGKISYWIIALVQGEKPIWTMQKIVVLAKQGGEIAEEDLQKHEACCLRSKGVVEIVVKLPRIAFAVGECIPVTTEITNSTKYNITGCKLSLFQWSAPAESKPRWPNWFFLNLAAAEIRHPSLRSTIGSNFKSRPIPGFSKPND